MTFYSAFSASMRNLWAIVNVENLNAKQGERLRFCLTSNNEHSMFVTERVLCKRAFGYA